MCWQNIFDDAVNRLLMLPVDQIKSTSRRLCGKSDVNTMKMMMKIEATIRKYLPSICDEIVEDFDDFSRLVEISNLISSWHSVSSVILCINLNYGLSYCYLGINFG